MYTTRSNLSLHGEIA